MVNKYLLTGTLFEGSITYGFNEGGHLCFFEVDAPALTDQQWKGFLKSLENVVKEDWFKEWAKHYKYSVTQLQQDLSFERFWHEYNMKRDKGEAEKLWSKLTDQERQLVFASLPAYRRYMQRNAWYNQLYAKTYLKNRHWLDEWDKL